MPPHSPSAKSPSISRRGIQLASATVLGVLVAFAVLGTLALGAYEAHCAGFSIWLGSF